MKGFSLIECLISLLLFNLIIVCWMSMQSYAVKETHTSLNYYLASIQLHNLIERLSQKEENAYLATWNSQNQEVLPGSKSKMLVNKNHSSIGLCWGYKNLNCLYTE